MKRGRLELSWFIEEKHKAESIYAYQNDIFEDLSFFDYAITCTSKADISAIEDIIGDTLTEYKSWKFKEKANKREMLCILRSFIEILNNIKCHAHIHETNPAVPVYLSWKKMDNTFIFKTNNYFRFNETKKYKTIHDLADQLEHINTFGYDEMKTTYKQWLTEDTKKHTSWGIGLFSIAQEIRRLVPEDKKQIYIPIVDYKLSRIEKQSPYTQDFYKAEIIFNIPIEKTLEKILDKTVENTEEKTLI